MRARSQINMYISGSVMVMEPQTRWKLQYFAEEHATCVKC